jgi:hypothetical protein
VIYYGLTQLIMMMEAVHKFINKMMLEVVHIFTGKLIFIILNIAFIYKNLFLLKK